MIRNGIREKLIDTLIVRCEESVQECGSGLMEMFSCSNGAFPRIVPS